MDQFIYRADASMCWIVLLEWNFVSLHPNLWDTKWWKPRRYSVTKHTHTHTLHKQKLKFVLSMTDVPLTLQFRTHTHTLSRVSRSLIFISTHALDAISTCAPDNLLAPFALPFKYTHIVALGGWDLIADTDIRSPPAAELSIWLPDQKTEWSPRSGASVTVH